MSVVNALSSRLEVTVRRGGVVSSISFKDGYKDEDLHETGTCGRRNTGTTVHFWPDASYFDSPRFSVPRLMHILRAKAVLCPGLRVEFDDRISEDVTEWYYEDGLNDYLKSATRGFAVLPSEPFTGSLKGESEAVDWAVQWLPEGGELLTESYVNLIPTPLGGTHVNGLRTGLLEAIREFCEFRNLLPRGVKLGGDDLWENCSYVLSAKLADPQFSGQTKERLSSRECAAFVSGVAKDAFSLWLNQHTAEGELLAELCISNAQKRMRKAKKVARKKVTQGPAFTRKTGGLCQPGPEHDRTVPGGRGLGGWFCQAGS